MSSREPLGFAEIFNLVEAVLWPVMGWVVLLSRQLPARPRDRMMTGLALVLFGATDVVEFYSGGWWTPWWLPIWKGVCIVVIMIGGIRLYRAAKDASKELTK